MDHHRPRPRRAHLHDPPQQQGDVQLRRQRRDLRRPPVPRALPGDVLWMRTNGPTENMKDSDVVDIEVPGIGALRNAAVREAGQALARTHATTKEARRRSDSMSAAST